MLLWILGILFFGCFILPFLLAGGLKLVFSAMPESRRIETLIRWLP
jgi:hypothetical protein